MAWFFSWGAWCFYCWQKELPILGLSWFFDKEKSFHLLLRARQRCVFICRY